MTFIASEVVNVSDLEDIQVGDDLLRFRLEVHRRLTDGVFFPKLWQFEFHRLTPTFPQDEKGEPVDVADAVILLEDHLVNVEDCEAGSVEECVGLALAAVERMFGGAGGENE